MHCVQICFCVLLKCLYIAGGLATPDSDLADQSQMVKLDVSRLVSVLTSLSSV